MSRTIRVDREVYQHIVASRRELEIAWGRSVTIDETVRQLLGLHTRTEDAAAPDVTPGADVVKMSSRIPARWEE